ncbi:MAG: RNA methyltransferase [Muribaculaceae bacterium]|nr:RNA methyltransferase [Muribaculaceae bacterium]
MSDKFEMVAKTFQGLENVLADELKALGAEDVETGRRVVAFKGDKSTMYRANFCCRTALRILKPIYKFHASTVDELYDEVKKYEWDKVLSVKRTFSIDSTVYSEEFRHSKFVTYRVKDAIADYFSEKYGERPSIRLSNPDVMFDVHISGNEVTLSLDSSGESLHKRGYRVAQTEAPINEVLAAGIIKLSGWDGKSNFYDPMCGSGTFLIEAALIAANINPGVYRNSFAFERWDDFDVDLFEAIYNDDSGECDFECKIYGSDISPKAIGIAKSNIKSARVGKYIDIQVKPLQEITDVAAGGGTLITNPPYGERISVEDMEALYDSIGSMLKNEFKGYNAWVISENNDLFDKIGLKPSLKYPILNGSIECELRQYVIFEGTYSDFRKEGRSVKNEDFRGEAKTKFLRSRFEPTLGVEDEDVHDEDSPVVSRKKTGKPLRREGADRPKNKFEGKERRFERGSRSIYKKEGEGKLGEHRFADKDKKFGRGSFVQKDEERRRDRRERRTLHTPKNALEERYQKSYHERRRDDAERSEAQRSSIDGKDHSEEFSKKVVRFREPMLSKEAERPVMRSRRNGLKNKDTEE